MFAMFSDGHKEAKAVRSVLFQSRFPAHGDKIKQSKAAALQWHADSSHKDLSCRRCPTESVTAAVYLYQGRVQVSSVTAC